MRLLAILPDDAQQVLANVVHGRYGITPTDAAGAVRGVRQRECDAVVLDPAFLPDGEYEQLAAMLRQRSVPVLLFTELTPASARRIVEAETLGPHDLVLRGKEEARLLEQHLESLEPTAAAMLLNRAARRLGRFPRSLQAAAVRLFAGGSLPRWVNELAAESGLARRTVDRWMERAGVDGASMLLDTARLARTWEPLVVKRLSNLEVSGLCGYPRERLFVAHALRIVDVAPSDFHKSLTRERFVERMTRKLLRK